MFLLLAFAALPLCAQTGTGAPPALAPAYGEIPPTFWEQHGTAVLVAGSVFVLLAALMLWKALQPKPATIIPPEMVARKALTPLLHQPEDGMLLSSVSQILRRYLVATFELPSIESTTSEFCAALNSHEKVGAELAQHISSFLRACDVQKFSPANPVTSLDATRRALEFISSAEKRRALPTATPQT